ncbi:SC61A [Hepatospora eriocheir]|uniref:SC61A n=1 Tax=Hepatospora eriocheir TaxID=1081669 RepID=A0A1X0QKU6_9MICR|nr:SC61A [Hepatospora eriocheir]
MQKNNLENKKTVNKEVDNSIFSQTIQLARPFLNILPEIKTPLQSLGVNDKLVWTILSIIVYSIASQVPLYGITNVDNTDSFGWLRVMMASNRGTLMDLGIGPVITASMIMNFLTTAKLIIVDSSVYEDKLLSDCFQKIITLLVTFIQGFIQVYAGYYGPSDKIPFINKFIIFFQLICSGVMIILLDELLQKGYGYGNGVNLFIASNACSKFMWSAFSPRVFHTARGLEFEGCIISTFYVLFARKNKFSALIEVLVRENLPNLLQFIYTILIFSVVIYIQQLRVDLNVISSKAKGISEVYPINLLYTSTTPAVILSQVTSNFCMISKLLYSNFPNNKIVRLMGVWDFKINVGNVPISGISYLLTPPFSFYDGISRPFYLLFYISFNLIASAFISKNWTDNQSDSSAKVYQKFKENGMIIKGVRETNTYNVLNDNITIASILSGLVTASVIMFCDITSTISSGTNMFLAASIINQYVKMVMEDSYTSGRSKWFSEIE